MNPFVGGDHRFGTSVAVEIDQLDATSEVPVAMDTTGNAGRGLTELLDAISGDATGAATN
jgi:hypothetical protein